MLKKKNLIKTFLVMLFSFVIFGVNMFFTNNSASAVSTPTLGEEVSGSTEGNMWELEDNVLSLSGVDWEGSLFITSEIDTINISGENTIVADGESIIDLSSSSCETLNIVCNGTLVLGDIEGSTDSSIINFKGSPTEKITFNGKCWINKVGGEEVEELEGDITPDNLTKVNYIRFESSEPATPPVRNASVTAKTESTSKKLNELAEGRIDIDSLFDYSNCDGLNRTYYLVTALGDQELSNHLYNVTVGEYKFKVVVSDDEEIINLQAEATLIVEKAEVTISVVPFSWLYGNKPVPSPSGNASPSAITYEYYYDASFNNRVNTDDGIPTEVGNYYVKVLVAETDTSLQANTTTTCSINPRPVSITWSYNSFVYTGEVQTIVAYYTDIKQQVVELNVEIDKEFKNAQSYTATASFKNGETSYELLLEEITREFTIRKVEISVRILNVNIAYGEELQGLSANVISGSVLGKEKPYELVCNIPDGNPIGEYAITGEVINPNYDITFFNGKYLITNKITSLSLENWVYGQEAKTPEITAYYGADKVVYRYLTESGEFLDEVPTEPGMYQLFAVINDDLEYNRANRGGVIFYITKIVVSEPVEDNTFFVYDGQNKTYSIVGENSLFSVSGAKQRNAGTHKVLVELNDPDHYQWANSRYETLEYAFVIHKKAISMPSADARIFKYNGNELEYFIQNSNYYTVSGNVQSDEGHHTVRVSLLDPLNIEWDNGSSEALEFDFIIRKADILNPITVNSKREELNKKVATIIATDENGVEPNAKLEVVVLSDKDTADINSLREVLKAELKKYDAIFKAYDISLKINDVEVQPDGTLTLKLIVPEELLNTEFKLYHIHTGADGQKQISEVEFSGANELGYIIVQTDKLSEFVFVYEKQSLTALIVTFACLTFVLLIALAVQLYFYFKIGKKSVKKNMKKALSVAPAMFIGGEVAWSIILGILSALLLAGNIVVLVLLLKKLPKKEKKEKSEPDSPDKAVDMSKTKVEQNANKSKSTTKKTTDKTSQKATKTANKPVQKKPSQKKKTETKTAPVRKRGEVLEMNIDNKK